MERGLGVAGDPVEDLARRSRPPGPARSRRRRTASKAGWVRIAPGDPDRLDPLAPVLVGREVVEPQRRVLAVGSVRRDRHRAARVRVHRPDVDLVAVARRRRRCRRSGSRAAGSGTSGSGRRRRRCERTKPPASKWFVAPGPLRGTATAAPMNGRRHHCQRRLHRHRLRARVLDVDLEMVLEVLADAGQVVRRRSIPSAPQVAGVADARAAGAAAAS